MTKPKTEPTITPIDGPAPDIIPTPHVDYHGNANLYLNTTPQATTLYELTGIDEQRWHIVGMNLHSGGKHRRDSVYIYAVDKLAQAKEGRALGTCPDGNLPVVSFFCSDLTVQDIFDNAADIEISFRLAPAADSPLWEIGLAEYPPK